MPSPHSTIDWTNVEAHFRAGIRTLEDIGREFGISKGRISQVAKKRCWRQDLRARITAQARAKVQRDSAREEQERQALNDPAKQAERLLAEKEVVDQYADLQAKIVRKHRAQLARAQKVVDVLLGELDALSTTEERDRMIEIAIAGMVPWAGETASRFLARKRKKDRELRAESSLPNRIDMFAALTKALERLIRLERQAYSIVDDAAENLSACEPLSDAERVHRIAYLLSKAKERRAAAMGHRTRQNMEPSL